MCLAAFNKLTGHEYKPYALVDGSNKISLSISVAITGMKKKELREFCFQI